MLSITSWIARNKEQGRAEAMNVARGSGLNGTRTFWRRFRTKRDSPRANGYAGRQTATNVIDAILTAPW
jgi:hypothetical protein